MSRALDVGNSSGTAGLTAAVKWNRSAFSALLLTLAIAGCGPSVEEEAPVGSFGLCSEEGLASVDEQSELVLDRRVVSPGDEVGVVWDPLDGEATLGPDLVAECWTGSEWVSVWVTREWAFSSRVELVNPGEVVQSNEEGIRPGAGRVLIPDEAPVGTYRVGGDRFDVRFVVEAES